MRFVLPLLAVSSLLLGTAATPVKSIYSMGSTSNSEDGAQSSGDLKKDKSVPLGVNRASTGGDQVPVPPIKADGRTPQDMAELNAAFARWWKDTDHPGKTLASHHRPVYAGIPLDTQWRTTNHDQREFVGLALFEGNMFNSRDAELIPPSFKVYRHPADKAPSSNPQVRAPWERTGHRGMATTSHHHVHESVPFGVNRASSGEDQVPVPPIKDDERIPRDMTELNAAFARWWKDTNHPGKALASRHHPVYARLLRHHQWRTTDLDQQEFMILELFAGDMSNSRDAKLIPPSFRVYRHLAYKAPSPNQP